MLSSRFPSCLYPRTCGLEDSPPLYPLNNPVELLLYGPVQDHNTQPGMHYLEMTQNPTSGNVLFNNIICKYKAVNFQDALGDFLALVREPNITGRALCNCSKNMLIPFNHISVFHKIKFRDSGGTVVDCIHIRLEQDKVHGWIMPVCFDTVLVRAGQQGMV